jgi:DNA mismatch repair protein MutS2
VDAFDEHTLNDLEFPAVRSWLLAYVTGPTATKRIEELIPSQHFPSIEDALNKVDELRRIKTEGKSFPALDFEELAAEIKLLPIHNAVLTLEGYIRIARASELINVLIAFFDKYKKEFPLLTELMADVYPTTEISDAIHKVFDRNGQIKDDASKKLGEIRHQMKVVRNQINRNFDREIRRLSKENVLGDTREAFLNERRVLTVLSTHKRKISGTVLGSSKTGSLTFIEPLVNIQLNNELEMLLDDERKEIYRILQALTREIAGHLYLIKSYQKILTELDFIHAKARLAVEMNGVLPGITKETGVELIEAIHPLLWRNNKSLGKPVVSQYIRMDSHSRLMVISGPNAGGKSITLKTIGLLQLMLQAGLLVPVNPNSKMCFFQQILTDIGDNQSIENELSTYSYRLKRMNYFLQVMNRRTLLLLDEFGTGSDPDLGGALAEVFFEEIYKKKGFGVITTHYANIKLKADALPHAVNGCMLFNTETLEPLYTFSIGQPGSSFTFEVAQINGIPLPLIEAAKEKMDSRKVKMDNLLNALQKEKNYLQRLNKEHIEAQEITEKTRQYYEQKEIRLNEKLRVQEQLTEQNNRYLTAGKKMVGFIDRYVTKSRKKEANSPLFEEIKKYIAIEKSKQEDQHQVKKLKEKAKKPQPKKQEQKKIDEYQQHKIVVGSTVKLISTRQTGTVESVDGDAVTVAFGFIRMKVERNKLWWMS